MLWSTWQSAERSLCRSCFVHRKHLSKYLHAASQPPHHDTTHLPFHQAFQHRCKNIDSPLEAFLHVLFTLSKTDSRLLQTLEATLDNSRSTQKMLALFTIAAAILASAVAAPAVITGSNGALDKRCKAKVENKPWQLTHIAAFEADPNLPTGISSISFDFCDTNKGLELQTRCEYNLPMHSGLGPIDHDNYHRCNNQDVQFKYEGTNITVSRTYKDDCLGDYPYNCTYSAVGPFGAIVSFDD